MVGHKDTKAELIYAVPLTQSIWQVRIIAQLSRKVTTGFNKDKESPVDYEHN